MNKYKPAIISNCCGAEADEDTGICSDCNDHCGLICVACDEEFYPSDSHKCKE